VHASDGLTDVPAAATVAVAAVVLWTVRDSRLRPALLAAAALLAVLAKPSGLVGVAALALAQLVGDRATLPRRVVRDVLPLAAGLLLGLGYDWSQALHEDMSLTAFLQSGVSSGIWVERAAAARPDSHYGWRWLGEPLHVTNVIAVAYALLRVGGARHRIAASSAVPAAWLWAFLGPSLADHPYRPELGSAGLACYVVAASLALAALAPESAAPSRLQLGRLLVWATPAVLIWIR
jgi:hypothetical protein